MPRIDAGESWEAGLRAAIRADKPGWTVQNKRGQIQLIWRPPGTESKQTVVLPLPWDKKSTAKATLLVNKIAKLIAEGQHGTLKGALADAQAVSNTMKAGLYWPEIVASLKDSLQTGRNEILDETWKCNYQRYCEEALRVLAKGKVIDGHGLLQETLKKWAGMPPSRAACTIALKNLTQHAVSRFKAPACWLIDMASGKELTGKPAKKKIKATLDDAEMRYLIDGVAKRNPEWANVLRVLCLFGLRPIELQHLMPKMRDDGVTRGVWCTYEKNCGGALTDQRWLEPLPITDADGEPLQWNLVELMHAGLLELPQSRDGGDRKLDGHYVEQFLKRQPEWIELKAKKANEGEWLRPYSFRDSFSLRGHRQKVEVGAVADAMGHSLEVHCRSYRWASAATTKAAFAGAYA